MNLCHYSVMIQVPDQAKYHQVTVRVSHLLDNGTISQISFPAATKSGSPGKPVPTERSNTSATWPSVGRDLSRKSSTPAFAALIAPLTRPNDRLKSAVHERNLPKVREILNDQNKVYWLSQVSLSAALLFAASQGDEGVGVVQTLLQKGVDVNGGERGEATPLQVAAEKGTTSIVNFLLEEGADVHRSNGPHGTALDSALRHGHIDVIEVLLQYGATFNDGNLSLNASLELASRDGYEPIVQLLLEMGADPKIRESTALHEASANGHERIVRRLLEKGVDVNALNISGQTALQCASEKGHRQVVQLLLEEHADVKIADVYGRTALRCAAENGHEKIVRLLLKNHAEVTPDVINSTITQRQHEVARILLDVGDLDGSR
jgi:ankyrin repeat protein